MTDASVREDPTDVEAESPPLVPGSMHGAASLGPESVVESGSPAHQHTCPVAPTKPHSNPVDPHLGDDGADSHPPHSTTSSKGLREAGHRSCGDAAATDAPTRGRTAVITSNPPPSHTAAAPADPPSNPPPAPPAQADFSETAEAGSLSDPAQEKIARALWHANRAAAARHDAAAVWKGRGNAAVPSWTQHGKHGISESRWRKFGGLVIERLLETAVLVDAQYLVDLGRAGGVMPRMQDLPKSARITQDTLWRLQSWKVNFALPIVVLSYPWLESTHPDRHGVLLRGIADILALVASEAVAHGGEHAAAGVMIDWCSLPQKPCTPAEQEIFDRGLSEMHYWYSHPFTHTLLLTTPRTDTGVVHRPYSTRGWCFFEHKMASLIKNSEILWDMANWKGQAAYADLRVTMTAGREPPSCPTRVEAEMRRRIEDGTLVFSYASDVEPVIAMYHRGFLNAFDTYRSIRCIPRGSGTSIFYGKLGWGSEEALVLAESIRYVNEHCEMADGSIEIFVPGNHISGEGYAELKRHTVSFATKNFSALRMFKDKLVVTGLRRQTTVPRAKAKAKGKTRQSDPTAIPEEPET
eukprot:m.6178 g.6178  ORF g.6178 m.6178 type:complete len:581 (+) comp3807_c0_seq1:136-1878(+)